MNIIEVFTSPQSRMTPDRETNFSATAGLKILKRGFKTPEDMQTWMDEQRAIFEKMLSRIPEPEAVLMRKSKKELLALVTRDSVELKKLTKKELIALL